MIDVYEAARRRLAQVLDAMMPSPFRVAAIDARRLAAEHSQQSGRLAAEVSDERDGRRFQGDAGRQEP